MGVWVPGRCAKVAGEMCKGCRGDVQRLPGRCAKVAGEMCQGCWGDVLPWENKVNSFSNQLKVESRLQVGVEFDNRTTRRGNTGQLRKTLWMGISRITKIWVDILVHEALAKDGQQNYEVWGNKYENVCQCESIERENVDDWENIWNTEEGNYENFWKMDYEEWKKHKMINKKIKRNEN